MCHGIHVIADSQRYIHFYVESPYLGIYRSRRHTRRATIRKKNSVVLDHRRRLSNNNADHCKRICNFAPEQTRRRIKTFAIGKCARHSQRQWQFNQDRIKSHSNYTLTTRYYNLTCSTIFNQDDMMLLLHCPENIEIYVEHSQGPRDN